MRVTVYSSPSCFVCKSITRSLTKKGVDFELKQLADHPEVHQEAVAAGLMALPVVTIEKDGSRDLFAGPTSCSEKFAEFTPA